MDNSSLQLTKSPVVHAQMLIRKSIDEVFQAFIDPTITTNFWFTKASGPLQQDKTVTWEWEMFGVSAEVIVKLIESHRRIEVEWGDEKAGFTQVKWQFDPRGENATLVTITEQGYTGTGDTIASKALDSMGGFCYVLAGAKAWLEHGVNLNLIEDHAPVA